MATRSDLTRASGASVNMETQEKALFAIAKSGDVVRAKRMVRNVSCITGGRE